MPTEVTYFAAQDQPGHQVVVNPGGRIGIRNGTPLNGRDRGPVVFVVETNGRVYAGNYVQGKFHHSSLLAGANVTGAGELYLDDGGKLTKITNKSGHYAPDHLRVVQGLQALADHGIDLREVDLQFIGDPQDVKAGAFLRREDWRLNSNNFGQLNSQAAENLLAGRPARTWILRQGANFEGRISYVDQNGQVVDETLEQVDLQAAGPRLVGSTPDTLLDQVMAARGLVVSRMVAPAPVAATASASTGAAAGDTLRCITPEDLCKDPSAEGHKKPLRASCIALPGAIGWK